ncbi:hypothetical protein NUBL22010_43570 [Klebsiella pneumoniae]|nr:hypothetical protein NUBL22010_43570 [Klebsiella pneumoniae]
MSVVNGSGNSHDGGRTYAGLVTGFRHRTRKTGAMNAIFFPFEEAAFTQVRV